MGRKPNPEVLMPASFSINGKLRPRPNPFPHDEILRTALMLWSASFPLPPELQEAVNHRLFDLLQTRHKMPTTTETMLAEVEIVMTFPGIKSEYHAVQEIARIHGEDHATLAKRVRDTKK